MSLRHLAFPTYLNKAYSCSLSLFPYEAHIVSSQSFLLSIIFEIKLYLIQELFNLIGIHQITIDDIEKTCAI